MTSTLLIAAVIIIACVLGHKLSSRLGIPMLLVFILLGMFFGSDGLVKIYFDDFDFAEKICSAALIFIMFYGGFGTKWSTARPIVSKATLLSTVGVVLTAAITALFCHYALHIGLLESFLIGSVVSSTDAASVFSILRSKRLNLKDNTASLLEVESGSNDPFSYMLTVIVLAFMQGEQSGSSIAYMVFAQLIYGIGFGVLLAVLTIWILKRLRLPAMGFDAVLVFALVLLSYAAPAALGGNGYLSTYIFGIILGNSSLKNKKSLVHFFDGLTGLMQMLVFFLLGLLSFPSQLPSVMLPALLTALFLTLVARPATVFLLLTPFRCRLRQQLLISFAGLRGAASIVFAIMVMTSSASTDNDVFHFVFFIVLFSILLQGSLLPFAAKKLDMLDASSDVMKTFNDYSDEIPLQFIEFRIPEGHSWVDKAVCDIQLPPETLLVRLLRGQEQITPEGNTVLQAQDTLILGAQASNMGNDVQLTELVLDENHNWIGKTMAQITLGPEKLIVMILRGDEMIIPNGKTVLQQADTLVILHTQERG